MTGYEWVNKEWRLGRIIDVLTFGRGSDFTLVELNKVLSTSSLTILLLSWLPAFSGKNKELMFLSMVCNAIHTVYSMNKYFGLSIKRILDSRGDMKLSLVAGIAANVCIALGYYGKLQQHHLMLASVFGGTLHYFFMKNAQGGGRLNIKPFAYIPLILFANVVYYQFKSGNIRI